MDIPSAGDESMKGSSVGGFVAVRWLAGSEEVTLLRPLSAHFEVQSESVTFQGLWGPAPGETSANDVPEAKCEVDDDAKLLCRYDWDSNLPLPCDSVGVLVCEEMDTLRDWEVTVSDGVLSLGGLCEKVEDEVRLVSLYMRDRIESDEVEEEVVGCYRVVPSNPVLVDVPGPTSDQDSSHIFKVEDEWRQVLDPGGFYVLAFDSGESDEDDNNSDGAFGPGLSQAVGDVVGQFFRGLSITDHPDEGGDVPHFPPGPNPAALQTEALHFIMWRS